MFHSFGVRVCVYACASVCKIAKERIIERKGGNKIRTINEIKYETNQVREQNIVNRIKPTQPLLK